MKKILFSALLLFGFATLSIAQETPAVETTSSDAYHPATARYGETLKVRHWSFLVKGGGHLFRTSTQHVDIKHNFNGYHLGAALEYSYNPFFGIGLDWSYNKFNRPFQVNGVYAGNWRSHTNDIAAYANVNITNIVGKYRKAQSFNLYAKAGMGAFFVTTQNYSAKDLMFVFGPSMEFNLSRVLGFNLGLEYRYYFRDQISGFTEGVNMYENGRQFQASDSWTVTAGFRFKFGGKSKPHAMNASVFEYYPLSNPVVNNITNIVEKADVAGLNQKIGDLGNRTNDLTNRVGKLEADVKALTEAQRQVVFNAWKSLEFDFDSSRIRKSSHADLDALANLLRTNPSFKVVLLSGHTDNIGTEAYNKRLSERRVNSVKTYLENKGVNAANIKTEAFGEAKPIASNATVAGRQTNRRVMIDVQP